ncbi:hypothetical protein [Streptomyces koelreuteriae]|uniref:hypothetical protein n=1 Tax=Streptomyces koelreuteriae TaxID=2838015 RepID=UPI003EB8B906
MSVTVKKTAGHSVEITWHPKTDDPKGYLANAIESDQLAFALESLGQDPHAQADADTPHDHALLAARHTTELARLLERRAAMQVVDLKDARRFFWRKIADAPFGDAGKQSTVRRMYGPGLRRRGY